MDRIRLLQNSKSQFRVSAQGLPAVPTGPMILTGRIAIVKCQRKEQPGGIRRRACAILKMFRDARSTGSRSAEKTRDTVQQLSYFSVAKGIILPVSKL